MAMQLKFGKQQLPIDGHFEYTSLRWHKSNGFNHMLIVLEQFFCQTHGPTQVVSDRAVNDLDFQHHPSANLRDYIIEDILAKMFLPSYPRDWILSVELFQPAAALPLRLLQFDGLISLLHSNYV